MKNSLIKKNIYNLRFVYSEKDTLSIIFPDNQILMGVIGEFNSNLKELEKLTNTNLYFRGNSIIVKNSVGKNEIIKNAIIFLVEQYNNNGTIEKKDIISSLNKFMVNENSKKENQKIEYIIKTPKTSVIPRSEIQKQYVRALKESDIIIISAPIYNYGPPATLKAWSDLAARVGETFKFKSDGRREGLLKNKRAYLVITSGGTKLNSKEDFLTPWLKFILNFFGIEKIDTICADQMALDYEKSIKDAEEQIKNIVKD